MQRARRGWSRPRARRWTTGASRQELAAALRRRLRPRDRRGRAGRDRPRRARVRGRRRRRSSRRARDGAVLPIADHPDEIVFQHVARPHHRPLVGADQPGVAADESHLSALGTGAVAASGTGSDPIKPGLASGEGPEDDEAAAEEAVEAAAAELAARPALHVWDRANTPPVPVPPDAYSLRLVAARTLYDAGRIVSSSPSLAALAHRRRARRAPERPQPHRRRAPRATTSASPRRAAPSRSPVRADAATAPGTAFMAVRPARRRRSQRPRRHRRRRSPSCAWRPHGDARVDAARVTDPLFDDGVDTTVVLIVIGKTIAVFVLLLLSVLMYIWFLRKVIAEMQNRIGPDRAGPVRPAPDASPTASSSSSRSSRCPTPPTGASSASRRTSRCCPRSSRSAIVPIGGVVTIAGHQTFLQLADLAVRHPVAARDVGPRALRRDARGLVVGLEVPAARLGARVGAAAQLRGRVRARHRRRARAVEHALDPRHRHPAGLGRLRVDLQRRLVLAAGDRRVRDLRDRRGRRDQPPAVRPRRGGAGAHRRVLHRVHRHPVRDLLPRRVHEPHHDVGDRGDALLRRSRRARPRLPRRRRLGQRLDHAGLLVLVQGASCCCSAPCGCAPRCRACATTSSWASAGSSSSRSRSSG